MTRFRVQKDQHFPSFSYFTDIFHETLGKWNNSNNITVRGKHAITSLSLYTKYPLSVDSSSREAKET